MNPPDPVSLFVSTLALIDYGCRFGYAHEEIGAFEDIVASATDIVSELKNKLREPVACHLTRGDKIWILNEIYRMEALLAKANKVTKGMENFAARRRIRWMFKKRGVAESYKSAILQRHLTLSHIRSSLIEMQNRGYGHASSWMESDGLSPSRQIANAPWEHPVDDNHWSSPTPRRIAAAQGGHGFQSPYPSRRIYKAAAITGRAIPLAVRSRRTNTDLHAWLLNSVLQNAR